MDDAPRRQDRTTTFYRQLREDVLAGAFPVGSVLLETTLAERYGGSRTPIREALNLLEHDGLLERAARGYRVRSGTPEDVVEIYEARLALESEAAGAAARRSTDLDLTRLAHLHERCRHGESDTERRADNFRFHEALWRAGHNATITGILTRLTAQLRIYDSGPPAAYGDLDVLDAEHDDILTALRDHDPDAASTAMRAHLRRSLDQRIRATL
ncbi:GntR family transcriptional regulator [Actinomycetospora flava]|uniref:GntR family transcriptional regulator n=1 Tax=Actinomycetospora flava TaxID=3129232 RepID=A0ABU8M3J7_9PSEU